MRVVTLNVWGRRGDWPARRKVLQEALRALSPDLAAMLEIITIDGYDQLEDLVGPGYHLVHQAAREPAQPDVEQGQGVSIASRWPIEDVRSWT